MKLFLKLSIIGLTLSIIGCGNCKETDSCSSNSDSHDSSGNPQATTATNPNNEVVIKDAEDLPVCDSKNQNATAYRKSNGKFFICRGNGWEEFDETSGDKDASNISQLKTMKLIWSEYKKIMPEEVHLEYLCGAMISVNADFFCDKGALK